MKARLRRKVRVVFCYWYSVRFYGNSVQRLWVIVVTQQTFDHYTKLYIPCNGLKYLFKYKTKPGENNWRTWKSY